MRIFVAIDIPAEIRQRIRDLTEALKPITARVRWSRAEALHVTLKFIGEISSTRTEEVKACLSPVRMLFPIPLKIRGSGYFPNDRSPRVIWLGIEAGTELANLAARVEESLVPLGIQKEERPFSPHLTLGRLRNPDKIPAVQEFLRQHDPLELGSFTAREFFLYESKLSPEGSQYQKLARFPLASEIPE